MTWKALTTLALASIATFAPLRAGDDAMERIAAARAALTADAADANDRRRAAETLFDLDPASLGETLVKSRDDSLVIAILDAVAVRADAANSGHALSGSVFQLFLDPTRKEVVAAAERTLRAMDRADRALKLPPDFRVRREIQSRLHSNDPEQIRLAARVLAELGDLKAADELVAVLEESRGVGPVADAAADGLELLLFKSFGPDAVAWREYLDGLAKRGLDSYVAVLRDSVIAERASADSELLQLKIELDENDPPALIDDLSHRLPAVRRFAAEALTRRAPEWDLEPAREAVMAGIRRNLGYSDVSVAMLGLLEAIDRKAGRTQADPRRDAALVLALESGDPTILAAAARAATSFPSTEIRGAVFSALRSLTAANSPPEARTAVVQAVGALGLGAARIELERLLSADESVDVRVAVAGALGSIRDPLARPALERALVEDKQWRVRRRAAKELAALDLAAATPALLRALDDARPEVRGEVALALAESTAPSAEVIDALVKRLATEEATVSELVRALGRLRAREAIDELCAVAGRIQFPASGSAAAPDTAAIDLIVRDLKEAFEKICGDDIALWNGVAGRLAAVDHAPLTVFAYSQPVRILLARSSSVSGTGGTNGGAANKGAHLGELQRARIALAEAALAANDLALAESVTSDALATEGASESRYRLLVDRASVLFRLDRVPDALAIYTDLLAEKTDRPADENERSLAIAGAARAYDHAGSSGAVIALLASNPNLDVELDLLLARAERKSNNPAAAAKRLEKLRAALPPSESLFDLELRCEWVETYLELGDRKKAESVALPAASTLPKDAPRLLVERLEAARRRLLVDR